MGKKVFDKDPLQIILEGEQITEVIKTRRGEFEVVFPLPSDLRNIELRIADMLGDRPMASFTKEKISEFRMYATLDVVITRAPKWWEDLDAADRCPDADLALILYRRWLRLYTSTQDALSRGTYGKAVGKVDRPATDANVADGAFSGITH